MSTNDSNRVLICPLDWGLGHATRCIPVIEELQRQGASIVLAADGGPLALLRAEFPDLEWFRLPGYDISYPKTGFMMPLHMAMQTPKVLARIEREHRQLGELIVAHNIAGVVSDNRFGLYSDEVPTVFLTHQVMIKAPALEKGLHRLNRQFIDRFTQLWVPDAASGTTLSGDLAHRFELPQHGRFVGPLSRFRKLELGTTTKQYDIMAVVSGPEPQRSVFANLLRQQLQVSNKRCLLVLGKAEAEVDEQHGELRIVSHLNAAEMQAAMEASSIIIARAGYSTIMDLAAIGARAVLVPTPGQTEQEYLGQFHAAAGHFFSVSQDKFDLEAALKAAESFTGISLPGDSGELQTAVRDFLALL